MSAHPIPGKVFIDPTSAAVGGTQVVGIAEDAIEFDPRLKVEHDGSGLEADAWVTTRGRSDGPPVLSLPVRDVSSTTLKLLLSLLSTGVAVASHGGNATTVHGTPTAVALVIRPQETTTPQDYFYGGRWVLHEESIALLTWNRGEMRYAGSVLRLCPERSLDGSEKAYMLDSVANIDTHYGLGGGGA